MASDAAQSTSSDDYARYVRDHIALGQTVRCRCCYEKVHEGHVGTVVKLDTDGLHDLNVQVKWHTVGIYWVRYVHLELIDGPGVGIRDDVRVKSSIKEPRHGWGRVTHVSVGKVTAVSGNGDTVIVNFPEQSGWTGLMSEMELAAANRAGGRCVFCSHTLTDGFTASPLGRLVLAALTGSRASQQSSGAAQRTPSDDYARYVCGHIAVGQTVRCRCCYEKVHEGDVGTVVKLDRDGLHDLNVLVKWQTVDTYCVRYVHLELVEGPRVSVGDDVRVKSSVVKPKYNWGNVTHASVGRVTAVSGNGGDVTVNFPEQRGWKGLASEMELATATRAGGRCVFCSHTLTDGATPTASPVPITTMEELFKAMFLGPRTSQELDTVQADVDTFRRRHQFSSDDDYARYVRGHIAVGQTVRCHRCYRKVHETDVGTVMKLDRDGLHDLNVQVKWQKADIFWVRYVHLELIDDSKLRIGHDVRVKASVTEPKFKWGKATHASVGKVTELSSVGREGRVATVNFPEHSGWRAPVCELELVAGERSGDSCILCSRAFADEVTEEDSSAEDTHHLDLDDSDSSSDDIRNVMVQEILDGITAGTVSRSPFVEDFLQSLLDGGSSTEPTRPPQEEEDARGGDSPSLDGSTQEQPRQEPAQQQDECQICLRPWGQLVKRAVVLPCMHGSGCFDCLQVVYSEAGGRAAKCPFCRGPFAEPPKPIFL